jgi:hypothetical protein
MLAGMLMGAATTLTIDLAFVLEGHTSSELPEQLIGSFSLNRPDLDNLIHVDENGEEDYGF